MTKLKTCPFCGGEAVQEDPETFESGCFIVGCLECGADTRACDSREEAVEAWNRRVTA